MARTLRPAKQLPKPSGVYWDLLSPQKLAQIRVLRELKERAEEETGTKLPEGPSETVPPTAKRNRNRRRRGNARGTEK